MTPATLYQSAEVSRRGVPPGLLALGATTRLDRWWKPKAANLLAILYAVALVTELALPELLFLLPAAIITIAGIGSFGHLVNDWYDIDADARAGKANRLAGMPPWKRRTVLLGSGTAALVPWLVLPVDASSLGLLILELGLLLAYVIPPVRLKERPVWPLFADGAYAYAVPAVLAAHTVFLAAGRPSELTLLTPLFLYQVALGVRHFLNHLALDRDNDLATGTPTLATLKGNWYIHRLIRRIVLPVELAAFLVYLLALSRHRPVLFVLVSGLFLASTSLHAVLTLGRRYPLIPYRFSRSHVDRLHQDILPLVLLACLTYADWRFVLLLVAHVALFYRIDLSSLGRWMSRWRWSRRVPALPVALLADPSKRLRDPSAIEMSGPATVSARPSARAEVGAVRPVGRDRVNIAVVNINKGKYTETFIDELIPRLQCNVYHLHGGELPRFDAEDRHFLSNWPSLQSLAHAAESVLHLEKNHFLENSIASYLQARQVRLVLAQFGPVGVQMLPITRDLGIPLIVCFHGYDVFHKEALRLHAGDYPALFREAAKLVAVSERMIARLEVMGAPREKLVHLPAFVNLGLFPYTDHSRSAARFLAVGRFAETKSPHLSILAFQRVVEAIPEATLTMVGKGGGGTLFEACVILVKSLGLEDRVEFKGVLSHEAVASEMRRARVFVQHSVTTPEHDDMEGKPVAIMEAMASGLPVVATRHSGIPELIEDGVTGLLVDEFDVAAMADAMIRLAQDDDLVRRMGRAASTAIHQHPLVASHLEILDDLIHRTIADS